jgi:hypothetical protein
MAQATVPQVPFRAAAHAHTEIISDNSVTITAASQVIPPISINAFGFLRYVSLLIQNTSVASSGGVANADFPFSLFSAVAVQDVNGAPLYGPISGYSAYLAQTYGGYQFKQDPATGPDFTSNAATAVFTYVLHLPLEINANTGLGALPNQNASATYKLLLTVNPAASIWTTNPAALPTFRVRAIGNYWSQPEPYDLAGRMQEIVPPNYGTAQYWYSTGPLSVQTGAQRIQVTRTGNLIRTLLFIVRTSAAGLPRVAVANMPDPVELDWDSWQMFAAEPLLINRNRIGQQTYTADQTVMNAIATGVFGWQFGNDILGHAGDGTERPFLPTVQSTRIEVLPTIVAGTTTMEILVNDIAPAEINQSNRYGEGSATTFQPAAA